MKKYKCILLVDDDPGTILLGQRYLSDLKITEVIRVASDGKAALDYIHKSISENKSDEYIFPEVILLDISMPVMGGFEFLKAFNEIDKSLRDDIQIFMLAVSDREADFQIAKDLEADGYIIKPLTKQKIIEALLQRFSSKEIACE